MPDVPMGTKIRLCRGLQRGACPEQDEQQGCAMPCRAMRSHAKPCCANCTVPCHATLAGDTLVGPRLASRLGRGSQPGRGILTALLALAKAWHHGQEAWQLCLEAKEKHGVSLHSQDPQVTRRYRFAGLCVKGSTVLIANTLNRFVVLL